jgi:hypothetical protein
MCSNNGVIRSNPNPWPLSGSLLYDMSLSMPLSTYSLLGANERTLTFHFHPYPGINDGSRSVVEAKSTLDYLHGVQSNATKQYLVYTMTHSPKEVVQLSNKRWCLTIHGMITCLSNPKVAGPRATALRCALLSSVSSSSSLPMTSRSSSLSS